MILGQYILTELGLNLIFCENSYKKMMDLLQYLQHLWLIWVRIYLKIKYKKITPEELFTNAYVKEVYESQHVRTDTK